MSGIKSYEETTLLKFQALILACENRIKFKPFSMAFSQTHTQRTQTERERERERERDMHFLVSKSSGQLDR